MDTKSIFFLLSIFLISTIDAKESQYDIKRFSSSIGVDTNTLLISATVKNESHQKSLLSFFDLKSKKAKKIIELPEKYKNRSIVAIAHHKDPEKYFIVTQWQRADVDNPQVHTWNSKQNTWEDLTEIKCKDMTSFEVSQGEIKFRCSVNSTTEYKFYSNPEIATVSYKDFSYEKIQISGALENQLLISLKNSKRSLTLNAKELF